MQRLFLPRYEKVYPRKDSQPMVILYRANLTTSGPDIYPGYWNEFLGPLPGTNHLWMKEETRPTWDRVVPFHLPPRSSGNQTVSSVTEVYRYFCRSTTFSSKVIPYSCKQTIPDLWNQMMDPRICSGNALCSVRIIHCLFVFGKLFILADRTERNDY